MHDSARASLQKVASGQEISTEETQELRGYCYLLSLIARHLYDDLTFPGEGAAPLTAEHLSELVTPL